MSAGLERAVAQPSDGNERVEPADDSWAPDHPWTGAVESPADIAGGRGRPVLAGFLILLALAWIAACGLALYRAQPPLTLINVVSWTATICVPIALIALAWLIFGRTSRAETEHFTRAVAQLRGEAESLDRVLAAVAERLASNREQLSGESARLMKLGEEASDRLGRVTHYLARESAELDRHSQGLESAASQARVDFGVLLADLPHAEQAARSFSETLREAGTTAHERARALEAQLSAIAARAQDADSSTGGAAERLSAHIARIETSAGVAAEQLDGATIRLDAAVDGALARTTEAVEATRLALDAQAQGLFATVEQSRARFAEAGADIGRQFAERIDAAQHKLVAAGDESSRATEHRLDAARQLLLTAGEESSRDTEQRIDALRQRLIDGNAESTHAVTAQIDAAQQRLTEASAASSLVIAHRLDDAQQRLLDAGEQANREIAERLAAIQALFAAAGANASGQVAEQLAEAQRLVDGVAAGIASQEAASRTLVATLGQEIQALDERLAGLGVRAEGQSVQMATALAGLRDSTATLREEVDAGTQEATALVVRAQDVSGALDAVTGRLRDDLPPALSEVEARATAARDTALAAVEPVRAMQEAAADGAARLAESEASVERQRSALEGLLETIAQGVSGIEEQLRALGQAAGDADDKAGLLVRETGPELVDALMRVREAARLAGIHARDAISSAIPESAASLGEAARQAMDASVTDAVRAQIAELEAASQHAAISAHKASERLTRQLLTLGAGAAALEGKIEEERALRDEQERGGMTRRVALLIESLNSTAIDVTKILSNEVTDTAWTAYLKGDRGVFTRRAVRLLETGEARAIARHYEDEPEFRGQVNRYVHDFETMLRRVLADNDGDTLSITLLSSDMGKLYVALAQAIDRLRR